jgi:hypothetical protein
MKKRFLLSSLAAIALMPTQVNALPSCVYGAWLVKDYSDALSFVKVLGYNGAYQCSDRQSNNAVQFSLLTPSSGVSNYMSNYGYPPYQNK